MPVEVDVHEAMIHLSHLLDRAMAGEEVIIIRSGKRLVRLMPVENVPRRRRLGTARGDFAVPDDFNAPLDEALLKEFER